VTDGPTPSVVAREPISDGITLVRFFTADFGVSEVLMKTEIVRTEEEIRVLRHMMAAARDNRAAVGDALQ
jgi:TctA family transporter